MMNKFWSLALAAVLAFGVMDADAARRLGGGKSMGQQSSNVTQREAAKPAGTTAAQAPAAGAPAAAAASAAPKRPWGAMLGGLAAGLGLAWLAHSLGMGAAFGQFLVIGLLVMAAMMIFGMVMRARNGRTANAAGASGPFALQGAGGASPDMVRSYSPDKVGNDASARPWERSTFEADKQQGNRFQGNGDGSGSMIGSGLRGSQNWGVPADFDTAGFLDAAKRNFVSLQAAWDNSDIPSLRAMMTDGMLGEIQSQLAERETHTGGGVNKTEVVMLDAQLLGIEDLGQAYMASVEFSGMIREEPSAGPSAFREVWNMSKPKSGGGWLVAGVQALQ